MMKRMLSVLLTLMLGVFSVSVAASADEAVTEHMSWAVEAGIIEGMEDGSLEPDGLVTRAQLAAMLVRFDEPEAAGTAAAFDDVAESDWYYPYVEAMSAAGIMIGDGSMWRPNDNVTREEAVIAIVRIVEIKDCFYNWEKAVGDKETPLIPVMQPVYGYVGSNPVYDAWHRITITNSTSKADVVYSDAENQWIPNGYDFDGSIPRTSTADAFLGGQHINQWVIDEENNMPIHGKTTAVINSNINNAFVEEPVSMEYQYTVSADNTVMLPDENTVSNINPNLANDGFIGIAFVSEREFEGQNVYTCDMLYQGGTEISADIFETYASDPDKRIYAVWCQAKTLGAQLGLNEENKGFRVLTAVNTDLLDNIGLDLPDDEYGRGATFVKEGNEYFIKADSKEWRGESYYTEQVTDVDNARVFSIFAALQPAEYAAEISYAGDILWNGNNADGTAAVLDFICNMEKTSATELANMYLSDLANAGEIPESVLTEEQFGILVQYIG